MALSKKAMFFSLIAILIVTMFVIYFRLQIDTPIKAKISVTESRVSSMNDFVVTFENVIAERALFAISHRALGAITNYITEKNNNRLPGDDTKFFVENITKAFQTAANESKIFDHEIGAQGEFVDLVWMKEGSNKINLDSTFQKLAQAAIDEMNIELDVNVTNLYIEQDYETGPWKVRVGMELIYTVGTQGIASWKRERTGDNAIMVEFDITDFIDPYIAAMTNGVLNRSISISKFSPRLINDRADFEELIASGNYTFENFTAPSFLFRFEGNTSPSYCCGIESFVYPSVVYPQQDDLGTPQCDDGLDNDGDLRIDLLDADCDDAADDDEFGIKDIYGNSYLDFQFWRGRCYSEEPDADGLIVEDPISELWVPEAVYNKYYFLKIDSYHRFKVYPNVLNAGERYMTTGEYDTEHAGDPGYASITSSRCNPTYSNYDFTI